MAYTLIGNDPVLGSNTLLWNEPNITEEVEFREDYTATSISGLMISQFPLIVRKNSMGLSKVSRE